MRISRTDVSSIARAQITRLAVRQALLLLGAAGAVLLLTDRLGQIDRADIWRALQTVGPLQWLMAMAATGVSFWAVGRYDAVLHRHLATLTPDAQASRAGLAAIAVSQTLGFGVVTGALVRWRMLPEMSLWQATRLTLAVSGSFIAGWSIVTAVAILVFRPPTGLWFALAWLPLVAILVLITLSLFGLPAVLLRSGVGRAVTLPSLGTIGRVVLLSALDTGAAALALYVLLPAELTPGLSEVLPAFLVALGVSMILGSPGGVGPFEVTLLSLLPGIAASPLLAAVLAYRVVYYGAPALYGAWLLVKGPNPAPQKDVALTPVTAITPKLKQILHHARRAESGLLNAGAMGLLTSELGNAPMAAGRTRQALVALGDPLADGTAWQSLACLERAASDRGLHPVLYKCGARLAVAARKRGYRVLPVAQEAWLAPAHFDLAAAQCRQLRRKLRKAEQGGIRITRSASAHPYAEMSEISAQWAQRTGGERGFSMGRFDRGYIRQQLVYLAYRNGAVTGYITLHSCARERTLDLIRHAEDAPDGTIHALVTQAIADAACEGCPRISLAAVPADPALLPATGRFLHAATARLTGCAGLRQFKTCFAPRWETLYVAAPSRLALALGCFSIAQAIVHPPDLRCAPENDRLHEPSSRRL